jgi:hypothetical protein
MGRTNAVGIAALFAAIVMAGLVARSGPARAQAEHGATATQGRAEPTGATREILQRAKGYRSWQKFSRYAQQAVLSKAHGKTYVVAWFNADAAAAMKPGAQDFPEGSTIVKENRPTPDGEPVELSVMSKRAGAWYWIKATPDWQVFTSKGRPVAGPDVAACAGCHASGDRDMVYSE